jgi:hypothetical protein
MFPRLYQDGVGAMNVWKIFKGLCGGKNNKNHI